MGLDALGDEGHPHQPGVVGIISGIGQNEFRLTVSTPHNTTFGGWRAVHQSRDAMPGRCSSAYNSRLHKQSGQGGLGPGQGPMVASVDDAVVEVDSMRNLLSKLTYRGPLDLLWCFAYVLGDSGIDHCSTFALAVAVRPSARSASR